VEFKKTKKMIKKKIIENINKNLQKLSIIFFISGIMIFLYYKIESNELYISEGGFETNYYTEFEEKERNYTINLIKKYKTIPTKK
jgi:hypothetical protein